MSGNQPPPPPFGNEPPPQPPGGGYGAPPPQPPGGGYGGPPPGGGYGGPPPGGGYGGPPVGDQPYDVGTAVSWSWAKFQQNAGQMILAALAIFVGALVILGIGMFLIFGVLAASTDCGYDSFGNYTCDSSDGLGTFGSLALMALFFGLFFIYAQVVGAGLVRASLGVTEGRPFKTSEVFQFKNLGPVIVLALIIGLGIMVGYVLCVIPAIIWAFVTQYALYFLIDRNLSPVDSIKASIDLVKNNLGPTILWYLVSAVIILIGELLCGVGLLVAIPMVLVGTAYTYKKLNGQAVAA
jgi:uncharacterized membrane protein